MALNWPRDITEENLRATAALAIAFYEQTGLREFIDSKFYIDCRQELTPGNADKTLIGDMMGWKEGVRCIPYTTRSRQYRTSCCSDRRWMSNPWFMDVVDALGIDVDHLIH